MTEFIRILSVLILALSLAAVLISCEEEGPMERAGEKMDEALEKAGDQIEKATDR